MACKRLRGKTKFEVRTQVLTLFIFSAFVLVGLLSGVQPALAQMTISAGCMEEVAGRELRCTANDVSIAGVADVNGDGIVDQNDLTILDDGCAYPGDEVTFEAVFEVVLNAQERHDIGIYFATDGDMNGDGALSGACSVSTVASEPNPPWLDLDTSLGQVGDTCGDIDSGHNPLYPVITVTTKCVDPDGNRKLNLPNCTSWRQPGANELCTSPINAFPGAPSKCRCDIGFEVPIDVPPASLKVVKTSSQPSVNEPGGVVTFTVEIMNTGMDPANSVDLFSLVDDVYGDLLDDTNPNVTNNTCLTLEMNIGAKETEVCTFDAWVGDNVSDSPHNNTVTAQGWDQRIPANLIEGSGVAEVTILDVLPAISVTKTESTNSVEEPGNYVTFTVEITNNSVGTDPVTITSLEDKIGSNPAYDLNGEGTTCSVPQTIEAGQTYSCSFTIYVGSDKPSSQTDVVTAEGSDDEGNPVMDSDDATVNITDAPSMASLTKTARPDEVPEPGGNVTFTVLIENTSTVDAVTINSLIDNIHGDLDGQGTCSTDQTIPAGGSYTCSFSAFVSETETDTVTASGTDDDGNPVTLSDSATVNVTNVPPSATLTKTASTADVTFVVVVTNTSTAEPLALTDLIDNIYGDIAHPSHPNIVSTTCDLPQTLSPAGQPGDSYSCSFVATVFSENTPETNTVTGTLSDDDGSSPINPSDTATVDLK